MILSVDPFSGKPMLLPRQKSGGGSSAGGGGQLFALVGTSLPSSGNEGQLYFDTGTTTLYVFANGSWVAISGGGGGTTTGTFLFVDDSAFEFIDGTFFDFVT